MSYIETLERVIARLDGEEKEKDKRIAELEKKLWRTEQKSEQAVNIAAEMIEHRDGRIEELENIINAQVFPSSGDGFSSEYINGYEEALGDLDKILKEQE